MLRGKFGKLLRCITHLLLFSRLVMSHCLWPHGLQHAKLPCPHYLLEYSRAHVHWVSDAIQSSHLSSVSLVAQPRSRHIWVLSSCFHREPSFVSPLIYRLWTEPRKTKEFAWGLTASGRAWTRSQAASFHWVVHPSPFSSLRESFRARSIKRQKLSFSDVKSWQK